MLSAGLALSFLSSIVDGTVVPHQRGAVLNDVGLHQRAEAKSGLFTRGEYKRQDGSAISFANPLAESYFVDGTKIPDVPFDAGPSWAGLMPISSDLNEARKLFFWFWPAKDAANADTLTFWTNGGPGCSSLLGFLQENGPISWSIGHERPAPPWSWTNLTNMVWVEQPVGTGYSQGTPNITNEVELAAQVTGFLRQFLEVFAELKGIDFYLSGESYAGYYIPNIANYIYGHPGYVDLALKGVWLADPLITHIIFQSDVPALRFVQENKNVMPFTSAFNAQLQNMSDTCGFTDYYDKYVTYPPASPLPFPVGTNLTSLRARNNCQIWFNIVDEIRKLNPAFNYYRVTDQWPIPSNAISGKDKYFDRDDAPIHAPPVTWNTCNKGVFVDNIEGSSPPIFDVLPNVIERSERVLIEHGLADMVLIAEGARAAIQNMTWGGAQGFQTPIKDETFYVNDTVTGTEGVLGRMHSERKLTYVELYFSGHMTPEYVPWSSFQTISYVLGKAPSPSRD